MIRAIALLPLLLALAACGKETAEAPADDRRGAEGEVLGGTISDAMLPLDTVQSQSPPLRETTGPTEGDSGEPSAPVADSEPSAPEPTAAPTPEAVPPESEG